ncbi:MAG: MBL fold metallo-hydrolase [Flavobacteriaceae bacterium]|nr:MBL fold metallo-hydrolase [Flavobacteriaceae bacterium]
MKHTFLTLLFLIGLTSCKNNVQKESSDDPNLVSSSQTMENNMEQDEFKVTPISHATMVIDWDGTVIYVDPVGDSGSYAGFEDPDLILITDIHGDHLNIETLESLETSGAKIIVPQAVADKLPSVFDAQVDVLKNGDYKERFDFGIEAIPMYNLRPEALQFHSKGRGNGYVIEKDGKRVYISGDTEDIPEMRTLESIDIAFVCMNLPYTMTVVSAADAVIEFQPGVVYPYHYRGTEGLSDVSKFAELVSDGNPDIKVRQLDWYPE